MPHSLPPKPPAAHGSGPVPLSSTPSDSKSSSGSTRARSGSSTAGPSESTQNPNPVPPAAMPPSDEESSSALIALTDLGVPLLRRLCEALGPVIGELHEDEMRLREDAHAQELHHGAELHAQKLLHRENLHANEREQASQMRTIKEGKSLAADEEYFNVENDIGGWDVLSREQFNDLKSKKEVGGDEGSGETIIEPRGIGLVGGNDFKEEDHVRTGKPDTGSSDVEPDQDRAVGQGDEA